MHSLIRSALDLSDIPWLGLEVGRAETAGSWGVLGYALMSAASEIEAARLGAIYYMAAPSLMRTQTEVEGDQMRLSMEPIYKDDALLPFFVEENIAGICAVSSEYLFDPMVPLKIWLSYKKPPYSDIYDEYFGCPIEYEMPENVFWTRAPQDQPLRSSDPISAQVCLKLVEQIVKQHPNENEFLYKLRKRLLSEPGNMPNMDQVAQELAMSPRTLRRKLVGLGATFRGLQDDVRCTLALDYIKNTSLNIDQIAHLMGYTETTNFRRAFKHWTGNAPTHYRSLH